MPEQPMSESMRRFSRLHIRLYPGIARCAECNPPGSGRAGNRACSSCSGRYFIIDKIAPATLPEFRARYSRTPTAPARPVREKDPTNHESAGVCVTVVGLSAMGHSELNRHLAISRQYAYSTDLSRTYAHFALFRCLAIFFLMEFRFRLDTPSARSLPSR